MQILNKFRFLGILCNDSSLLNGLNPDRDDIFTYLYLIICLDRQDSRDSVAKDAPKHTKSFSQPQWEAMQRWPVGARRTCFDE